MIVPRKYMLKISAVGLFCCDKFEEIPNKKVSDLSKLTKPYFSENMGLFAETAVFQCNAKSFFSPEPYYVGEEL